MGKSELLMVLAGIALSIMIALITIPTFTKGNDLAKISLINSDISSIRKVSQTYVESRSPTGNFLGINAEAIGSLIPGLKTLRDIPNDASSSYFISSANENIKYIIKSNAPYDTLILTIKGLNVIKDAEESILKNQEKLNINSTPDTPKDGEVVLHFKG